MASGIDISAILADPSSYLAEASSLFNNPSYASEFSKATANPSFVSSISKELVSQFGSSAAFTVTFVGSAISLGAAAVLIAI
jgi:hypothetical protein